MAAPSSGAALESLAMKRLRSFALFAAKKRVKYAAACELFGQAARAYLSEDNLDKAAECCKQQARLCINKLQQPVESAMHYMESTRAYMLSEEYTLAFQCLQLAVQARTHPNQKHKFDDPHAAPFSVTSEKNNAARCVKCCSVVPNTPPWRLNFVSVLFVRTCCVVLCAMFVILFSAASL
jgi:tetratricopeptide (TPR) repeat protein